MGAHTTNSILYDVHEPHRQFVTETITQLPFGEILSNLLKIGVVIGFIATLTSLKIAAILSVILVSQLIVLYAFAAYA